MIKPLKLKISTKSLLFFLVVSLLPLVVVSFILVTSANTQLRTAASTQQQIVATDLASKVDSYLSSKTNQLSYLAQITATSPQNRPTSEELTAFLKDDPTVSSLQVLDSNGFIQTDNGRTGPINPIPAVDQSGSDAFKAAYFLAGRPFISSVSYDARGNPSITIAVPLPIANAAYQSPPGTPAEKFGSPGDINGVIVASYNISDLWQSVLSTKIGSGGYAYVVDGLGNLIAHPNRQFLTKHQKLANVAAVSEYRNGSFATIPTTSEFGQAVISTPRPLSKANWAVIVEEPVSSIYHSRLAYIRLSAVVGVSAIILATLIAIYFSRQLTGPIKKLSDSAKRFGAGQLDQVVDIKTNDELQDLAETFNKMGLSIKQLVGDLRANNLDLTTERTKLARIIDSVSDGIIALNAKGQIVSINPPAAQLINQTPDSLAGHTMADIFPWELDNKRFTPETTKPGIYNYSDLLLTIGSKISYLDLTVFVLDRTDTEARVIITIRDLTKSRELDFMKLDFVAIAAHELRTPLTVVRGYLDMVNLEAVKKLSVINIENLQKAMVGADQLRDLINKLLNIAHIERGDMELLIEKLNLSNLIKDNVHNHLTPAAQKLQILSANLKTDKPVYVPADPAAVTEVLNNLIGNAIKYTPEKGNITVSLTTTDSQARVEVTDNGPGIPTELRPRLFTKFYRAERSLIAGSRGTGLGLFISKTIIELHGGTIGLEEGNKGSTFYFTLPIYKAELHDKLLARNQKGGVRGWFKKRPHS